MKKILLTGCLIAVLCIPSAAQTDDVASAQHLILGQQASGSSSMETRKNTHTDAQWFPDAGLGLFVHIGIAAVHGGIDLSWSMLADKSWEDGEITPVEYWALADRRNPRKFNADKWVKAAKEAGFKYIVMVTKHHDGYTMWPSRYSDFGVGQKLGGRDLVREFVDACRKHGVKVGLYYSPPDWHFDAGYRNFGRSGKMFYDINHNLVPSIPKMPEEHRRARLEMVRNQVTELLTDYGKIDILWFDGGKGEISNDEVRRLQPGIIVNRRNGEPGDFGDSEGVLPQKRFPGWFETNDPCWPSRWWGYSTSDRMDSADDVIEKLVIMRAWGGNYLANVGPKADGSMPEEALAAWKDMARWMKHSGESVFGTTGGPFPEKANQPVTIKGDSLMYLHAFPNMHKAITVQEVQGRPVRAVLLRTGEEIPFTYEDRTLKVQIPADRRTRSVDTVKIFLEKELDLK